MPQLTTSQQVQIDRLKKSEAQTQQRIKKSIERLDTITKSQSTINYSQLIPSAATVAHIFKQLGYMVDNDLFSTRSTCSASIIELARQAGGRARQIILEENWWKQDNGPLIATLVSEKNTQVSIALVREGNYYTATNHHNGESWEVNIKTAEKLNSIAYMLYAPLPEKASNLIDIIKFLLPDIKQDIRPIIISGGIIALLGILYPIVTALVIDTLIPGSEKELLIQIGVGLAIVSTTIFAFNLVQDRLNLRIQGRSEARLQAALWDKVLKLPTTFFKKYSAGDLNQRIQGMQDVREALLELLLSTSITVIFSIVYLILLFVYLPKLAFLAIALVIIFTSISFITGWLQIKYIRQREEVSGHLSGMVFETLQGIVKLRVANAQGRAFARWAEHYATERQAMVSIQKISNNYSVFAVAYQTIALATLFIFSFHLSGKDLSAGTFIAFLAAYSAFQAAFMELSSTLLKTLAVMPQFERAKPILSAKTEDNINSIHPGHLAGNIEISHVNFAYTKGGEEVLKDISINIEAGSQVALVGSSGSGKSTLIRILLGFEKIKTGTILYDGQDLSTLDLNALRQQIGVVLQNGRVFAGSIFENIKGASNATLQDCEIAASQAGLDNDLEQFPMGLHTPLTEGATTISGGQRQRILIARALVKKPALLFMDEATSALDNHTQSKVTTSLNQLAVTQIIVAHRLSTVIKADIIIVLNKGRIIESGTYDELMQLDGYFATSARRQLV